MSKTRLKSYKASEYDSDQYHHDIKRKKSTYNQKQYRNIDNLLKTKNYEKIMDYDEKY